MQAGYFELIMEIMPIYSKKVIASLRDFLVMGFSRKEACSRNDVSPAYFSVVLKKFRHTEDVIYRIEYDYRFSSICRWDSEQIDSVKNSINSKKWV